MGARPTAPAGAPPNAPAEGPAAAACMLYCSACSCPACMGSCTGCRCIGRIELPATKQRTKCAKYQLQCAERCGSACTRGKCFTCIAGHLAAIKARKCRHHRIDILLLLPCTDAATGEAAGIKSDAQVDWSVTPIAAIVLPLVPANLGARPLPLLWLQQRAGTAFSELRAHATVSTV